MKLASSAILVFFISKQVVAQVHTKVADKDVIGACNQALNFILSASAERTALSTVRIIHVTLPSPRRGSDTALNRSGHISPLLLLSYTHHDPDRVQFLPQYDLCA